MKRLMFLVTATFIVWGNIAYGEEDTLAKKKFSLGGEFSYTFLTKNDRQVLNDAPGFAINTNYSIKDGVSLKLILGSSFHKSGKKLPPNVDSTSLNITFLSGGFKYAFKLDYRKLPSVIKKRLQPFIDLGLGIYMLEAKTEASDGASTNNESDFGINFGAGMDWLVRDYLSFGVKTQNHYILGKGSTASDLISISAGFLLKF